MCKEVSPDGILAYLLLKRKEITIEELRTIKQDVEKSLPDYYIDVTRNSLFDAVMEFPQMFEWRDASIRRACNSDKYFKEKHIQEFFSVFVPRDILPSLRNAKA